MPVDARTYAPLQTLKSKPLHAALAALLGLHAAAAHADWTVTSCDEGSSGDSVAKTGTLRYAAANAANGDYIYLNSLACSQISLTTGAIEVPANNVLFVGPEDETFLITAKYTNPATRVFRHTGTGELQLRNLTISGGEFYSSGGLARGGCVFSAGSVELWNSDVIACKASTASGNARGGGVYAAKDLRMRYNSSILSSGVDGGNNGDPRGGGAYVLGNAIIEYSTISGNTASRTSGSSGSAGGLLARGSASILGSTISKTRPA